MGAWAWYHTRMCKPATTGSSPSPICTACEEAFATQGTLCDFCAEVSDHPVLDQGYEADEEHALYWDQHAEG